MHQNEAGRDTCLLYLIILPWEQNIGNGDFWGEMDYFPILRPQTWVKMIYNHMFTASLLVRSSSSNYVGLLRIFNYCVEGNMLPW